MTIEHRINQMKDMQVRMQATSDGSSKPITKKYYEGIAYGIGLAIDIIEEDKPQDRPQDKCINAFGTDEHLFEPVMLTFGGGYGMKCTFCGKVVKR